MQYQSKTDCTGTCETALDIPYDSFKKYTYMNKITYKSRIFWIITSIVLLVMAASCSNKELMYNDEPGIYINKETFSGRRDSMSYSFAEKADDLDLDTIYIPVKISGFPKSVKRKVPLVIDDSRTTAKAGVHYQLIETWIDADSIVSTVPLIVKRAPDLKNIQVNIYLEIRQSEDFPYLIDKTKTNNTYNGEPSVVFLPGYLIKLNDQLLKPDTWDASGSWFKYFFGNYSDVKWKFILDVTGRTVWGPRARDGADAPTGVEMYTYYAKLLKALYEYEKENGTPMLDELGNPVVLPII